MTIPSLSAAGLIQPSIQKSSARLQAVIASLVSGQVTSDGTDVAALSIASQLQSQTNHLRQVSGNLAQASSLLQVADGSVSQIQSIVQQLQSLAQQSQSPALNADTRQQLDQQFQQLSDQVDSLATGTAFNGQNLLDGSFSGNNALSLGSLTGVSDSGGDGISVPNLSAGSLFGQSLSIASPDSAGQALSVLDNALGQVASVGAGLGALQQTVDYAAANVDSALANQEAARASLQDTNIPDASTQYALANIQQNAGIALAAQGNNLTPALLQLIQ